jgi:(p)ppGpp synthase/HD superfamily hydrolase
MSDVDHPETPAILRAISFASRAHLGQFRKDGLTPYSSHAFRVCFILRHIFRLDDENVLVAAVLHDTIEDTTVDFDDVEAEFGSQVAQWVAHLSKDKRRAYDEREQAYCRDLTQAPWQVQVCKLADIHDNLLDSSHLAGASLSRTIKNKGDYLHSLKAGLQPEAAAAFEITESLYRTLRDSAPHST